MSKWHALGYGVLVVANAVLAQLAIELGAGRVPVPPEAQWAVPVVIAALTALTALLPALRRPPQGG